MVRTKGSKHWYPYIMAGIVVNLICVGIFAFFTIAPKEQSLKALEVNFVDYDYGGNGGGGAGTPEIAMPSVQKGTPEINETMVEAIRSKHEVHKDNIVRENKNTAVVDRSNEKISPVKQGDKQEGSEQGNAKGDRKKGGSTSGDGHGTKGPGNNLLNRPGFTQNSDGSITAASGVELHYKILREATPHYPQEARAVDYNKPVVAEALILVGLNGDVEQVKILNSLPNLGFKEEAIKALYKMKYAPIYVDGVNVKKYFKRNLRFVT